MISERRSAEAEQQYHPLPHRLDPAHGDRVPGQPVDHRKSVSSLAIRQPSLVFSAPRQRQCRPVGRHLQGRPRSSR